MTQKTDDTRQRDWGLLAALFLPLIALLPTLGEGVVAGADIEVHIHRVHAMALALENGTLWPRWISYLHLGYGYPIFNYYAPGYIYITALLELAGLHITTAYNLVQSGAWMFGSAGMYLLTRRFLPAPAALLSAALWAYAPSRLYEVWWQGSLAQIVAASFIPYLLLGVIKNAAEPTLRRILAIALPFAALILSHTPMMYISALYAAPLAFFAPIWMTNADWRAVWQRWLFIGSGFVLGVGLATIFLMPTLLELPYVLIAEGIGGTVNYLVAQFLPAGEIFTLPRLIDATDMYLDFPRTLGLLGGLLCLFGVVALWRRKQYGLLLIAGIGLGFTLFMLLDESLALWLNIPGFANLRFPARLLRMGAVLVGILGGASILLLPRRWQLAGMGVGIVLVVLQITPVLRPYETRLNWDNISALDEIEHELQDRTWGTVSYDEFNPIWGERIFLDAPEYPERYIDEPFHLRVFERDVAATNWRGLQGENLSDNTLLVTTDEARAVRFRQYYFPGWVATVNGEPATIYPDEQIGLITIDLPAGEHVVTLNYRGTPVQQFATALSAIAVVICLVLYRKGERWPDPQPEPLALWPALVVIVAVGGVALFNQNILRSWEWLKRESPPDNPAYMQTVVNANFGDEVMLLGYTLHSNSIGPDAPLRLDLYWRTPDGTTTNYQPLVQLVNLNQNAAWAVSNPLQTAAGETSDFSIERFARDPHTLRLNDAVPSFVGRIAVQLIGPEGDALPLAGGQDRLLLEPLIPILGSNDVVPTALEYQLGEVAELRCATVQQINDERYQVTLGWQLNAPADSELVVLVHGLDADGEIVTQGDGPPFAGDYPAQHWRAGQALLEVQALPYDPAIEMIAVGLYTRDTVERLPVLDGDIPVQDNRILLSLGEDSC